MNVKFFSRFLLNIFCLAVLAWLQSPTANGLFSPGGGFGFGSAMNTPRAGTAPRTPRTPTNTTSFFFSDVASLPRNSEFGSPRASPRGDNGGAGKRGPQGVYSSMICISPLASKNRKGNSQPQTPMNYNDVFASPREIAGNDDQRIFRTSANLLPRVPSRESETEA